MSGDRRWKGYADDWPFGHRLCLECNKIKPYSEFHKHRFCKGGYNTRCKICRKPSSKKQYRKTSKQYRLWFAARCRARKRGLDFNLEKSDITIPERCPVFGFKLEARGWKAPSVDRIDPNKGYVKGNIKIISKRANTIKNNASKEELQMIIDYINGCEFA